jgi:hypothetical protein
MIVQARVEAPMGIKILELLDIKPRTRGELQQLVLSGLGLQTEDKKKDKKDKNTYSKTLNRLLGKPGQQSCIPPLIKKVGEEVMRTTRRWEPKNL